ncbi:MAG: antitoxin [Beijerinckiaceae bacterium]
MTANAHKSTAKLFMHGRSQAVRLPKEFRFEGTEVRVSKVGDKVILEPMEKPPFDVKAWRAKLDALGAADFLVEGAPEDPPVEDDDKISFD